MMLEPSRYHATSHVTLSIHALHRAGYWWGARQPPADRLLWIERTGAVAPTPPPSVGAAALPTIAAPTAVPAAALKLRFPSGVLWGVATSAYQIEGAVKEDGRGESVWDVQLHAGEACNGDIGDVADDHYHRYEQDLNLMQDQGFQTYRFSIAWLRILPTGSGAVNQKGLDCYILSIPAKPPN